MLWPVSVRIGLASGSAIVGNMGSLERFDYSVLGETVNLASRAEGLCKQVAHNIVIAGPIHPKTKALAILDVGAVVMRGKTKKTPIHIVLGDETWAISPEYRLLSERYQQITGELRHPKLSRRGKNLIDQTKADSPQQSHFLETLKSRIADYQKD